jgi:hypothetical protein
MSKTVEIIEHGRKMKKKAKMHLESRKLTRSGFFLQKHEKNVKKGGN